MPVSRVVEILLEQGNHHSPAGAPNLPKTVALVIVSVLLVVGPLTMTSSSYAQTQEDIWIVNELSLLRFDAANKQAVAMSRQLEEKLDAKGREKFHKAEIAFFKYRDAIGDFALGCRHNGAQRVMTACIDAREGTDVSQATAITLAAAGVKECKDIDTMAPFIVALEWEWLTVCRSRQVTFTNRLYDARNFSRVAVTEATKADKTVDAGIVAFDQKLHKDELNKISTTYNQLKTLLMKRQAEFHGGYSDVKLLEKTQQTWLAYRKAEEDFVADVVFSGKRQLFGLEIYFVMKDLYHKRMSFLQDGLTETRKNKN